MFACNLLTRSQQLGSGRCLPIPTEPATLDPDMEPVISIRSSDRPPARPGDDARDFAIRAAKLADDLHCRNVAVLDVRGISPVTDFFVIATGSSGRQMRSIAQRIEELGEPHKFIAYGRNGHEGENWVLTDFVDVVLHVLSPESRSYYDLDGLWGDAPRVAWRDAVTSDTSVQPAL